tara:strand:+ start:43 stop:531 length:489 start_codon:yes stop_codon:yes gene_type:complete
MNKLFLTMLFAFYTIFASAQFVALTTVNKVEGITATEPNSCEVYNGDICPTTETEDSWNITDKIGIGYMVNEKLMVGITMDGEDAYELLGRYTIHESGLWATCVYNYDDETKEVMDRLDVGIGYSWNIWKGLTFDPNYTMPLEEDDNGEREGTFNLGLSYKF